MDTLCQRMLFVGSKANGSILRQCGGGARYQRNLSMTISRPAKSSMTKKQSKPPLKTAAKPLPKFAPKKASNTYPEYKPYTPKTPPQSHPIPTSKSKPNPFRHRIIPIFFGSIALVGFSGGLTYLYVTFTREDGVPVYTTPSTQQDVSTRYDKIANNFDETVDWTESISGINALRRKLASQAVGDVLEVSIGTGRNLEFYSWDFKGYQGVGKVDERGFIKKGKVTSFTAVDKSGEMLEIAHEKFGKMFPGILGVRWIIADAAEKGAIPGPPKNANERSGNLEGKYDTVLQTMGLCSVSDPVGLLKNLGECVKEEEGRILLLEHGRGSWDWMNKVLDKTAEGHAKEFGCWWNRDMRAIVKESGLEVVKIERPKWWHFGTTWWIELKKPKSQIKAAEAEKEKQDIKAAVAVKAGSKEEPLLVASAPKKKGWW